MPAMPLLALPASSESIQSVHSQWPVIHLVQFKDACFPLSYVSIKRVSEPLCVIEVTRVSVHHVQITSCYSLLHTFLLAANQFSRLVPVKGSCQ